MELQLNPAATPEWYWVGDWPTLVMVVDDYLLNAEEVRRYALTLAYGVPSDYYPGLTAHATVAGATKCGCWIAERVLSQIFETRPSYITTAGYGNTECRFAVMACDRTALPQNFGDQHADAPNRWLATVLHLSPDVTDRGTALWQHAPSGMQSWLTADVFHVRLLESLNLGLQITPQFDHALTRLPIRNINELSKAVFRTPSGRRPFSADEDGQWRLLKLIEAKFNRLVVYPTWQIHSIVDGLRSEPLSLETMRLTMNQYVDFPVPPELGLSGPRSPYRREFYAPVAGLRTC